MLELAFNELSLDTASSSRAHSISMFEQLFSICDEVNLLKFSPLKLRTTAKVKSSPFKNDHYTLHDYLESLSEDKKRRYLGYLAQVPLIMNNPYYRHGKLESEGFGYAYESSILSVSINNPDNWRQDSYTIERDYLPEEGNTDIQTDSVSVEHIHSGSDISKRESGIKDGILKRPTFDLTKIKDIKAFVEKLEEFFPFLSFAKETAGLILKFASLENPDFIKTALYFERLNHHLQKVALKMAQFDNIPGGVSPDGPTTLQMFGDERTFTLPDGTSKIFSLHAKLGGNLRIYLYPQPDHGKYIVGHVGHHLRTKNFRK